MISKWGRGFLLAATLVPAANGVADSNRSGIAVAGDLGTLGYGADLFYRLNDSFVVRGGFNGASFDRDMEEEDVTYEATLTLESMRLGVDYYPFKGGFRLSAAYGNYGNEIDLVAEPSGNTIEINDEEYNTETEIDSLTGNISNPSGAAYLGMGWGNPVKRGKRFGVMFDVGVMMVGEADVELVAVCPEGSLSCHSLQSDVDIEEAKLQEDLGDAYKFWPVVNLALSYQF